MNQSKYLRSLMLFAPVSLGIEYAIAYFVAGFVMDKGDAWWLALIIMAAFYGFRVINWVLNIATGTLFYYFNKPRLIDDVVSKLYANKVPVIDEMNYLDGTDVLDALIKDEDVTEQVKIFAAVSAGELAGVRTTGGFFAAMRVNSIIDAAFARYLAERNAKSGGVA